MKNRTTRKHGLALFVFLSVMLVVQACSPVPAQTEAPTSAVAPAEATMEIAPTAEATVAVAPTAEPTMTVAPTAAPTAAYDGVSFSFGSDLAANWSVEFIPQGPGSSAGAGPVDYTDPEHLIFTLGYYADPQTCCSPLMIPRIYIYPAAQMTAQNPVAAPRIAGLQAYLASPPADLMDQSQAIPFLPLFNAAQVFHTQVKFLDFQNGRGVRFLTMYSQGPVPINNAGILYTFQGLTSDGAYYVAVTMPINNPILEGDPGDAFMTDPLNYVIGVAQQLDRQATNTFTPDLAALDAMIQSLLVRP